MCFSKSKCFHSFPSSPCVFGSAILKLFVMLWWLLFTLWISEGAADRTEEAPALLQLARKLTRPEVPRGVRTWKTKRDLANVTLPDLIYLGQKYIHDDRDEVERISLLLDFQSAVPVFGPTMNYIALIAAFDDDVMDHLRKNPLFCTGANGTHRQPLELAAYDWEKYFIIFYCPWPQEESLIGEYHIFLEDAHSKVLGKVVAKSTPGLLKQYDAMACVRNLWNDPKNNASGLRNFPQWLDFHRIMGIDHFIVYTTSDTSPAIEKLYQPYIDEGHLASAVDRFRPPNVQKLAQCEQNNAMKCTSWEYPWL